MPSKFDPLGIVAINEDGQYIYIPMKSAKIEPVKAPTIPKLEGTGVVSPPSPEEVKIGSEVAKDYSLGGIIKKNAEREKDNDVS